MYFSNFSSDEDSWLDLVGKSVIAILLINFSSVLIFSQDPWIFLDGVNLLIHEFGHLAFAFGGETIGILGGTLMQLIVPSLFLIYYLKRTDFFSSSFCIFWIGDNFINISRYIRDARSMALPLVGGGEHDWNILLTKWGLLENDIQIGNFFYGLGTILLIVSIMLIVLILLTGITKKMAG